MSAYLQPEDNRSLWKVVSRFQSFIIGVEKAGCSGRIHIEVTRLRRPRFQRDFVVTERELRRESDQQGHAYGHGQVETRHTVTHRHGLS